MTSRGHDADFPQADAAGLNQALTGVRLAILDGDLPAARHRLGTVATDQASKRLRRCVFPLALLSRDMTLGGRLLGGGRSPRPPADFYIADGSLDKEAVLFRLDHARAAVIGLSPDLFGYGNAETVLQRLFDFHPVLDAYARWASSPIGSVQINLGDVGHGPGVSFCDNRRDTFLAPDCIFMHHHGYARLRRHFALQPVCWADRKRLAFWRGSTTGLRPRDRGWRGLARIELCAIGAAHPDLIDAGITQICQISDPVAPAWLADRALLRPPVSPESFQSHRYQIDIDGNSNSWPGLFIKLLTGSPVLKVMPRDGLRQWYYDRLIPWRNYVPVQPDMDDLVDKVRWLRDHDDEARAIGEAGAALARSINYAGAIAAGRDSMNQAVLASSA